MPKHFCMVFPTLAECLFHTLRGSGKSTMVAPSHERLKRCPEEVRTEKTEEGDVASDIPLGCSGDSVTPQRDARTPLAAGGRHVRRKQRAN